MSNIYINKIFFSNAAMTWADNLIAGQVANQTKILRM